MILLDAYALVAFLVGGPAATQVRQMLRDGDAGVATANLAEALDVAQRVYALPIPRTAEILEPLFGEGLLAVPLDAELPQHLDAEVRRASLRGFGHDRILSRAGRHSSEEGGADADSTVAHTVGAGSPTGTHARRGGPVTSGTGS